MPPRCITAQKQKVDTVPTAVSVKSIPVNIKIGKPIFSRGLDLKRQAERYAPDKAE
jgi:hypothetical protein